MGSVCSCAQREMVRGRECPAALAAALGRDRGARGVSPKLYAGPGGWVPGRHHRNAQVLRRSAGSCGAAGLGDRAIRPARLALERLSAIARPSTDREYATGRVHHRCLRTGPRMGSNVSRKPTAPRWPASDAVDPARNSLLYGQWTVLRSPMSARRVPPAVADFDAASAVKLREGLALTIANSNRWAP
jgi:hypothetical protein